MIITEYQYDTAIQTVQSLMSCFSPARGMMFIQIKFDTREEHLFVSSYIFTNITRYAHVNVKEVI